MTSKLFLAGVSALALALAPITAWPAEKAKNAQAGGQAQEKLEAVESANPQWDEDSTKGQERAAERPSESGAENAGKKAEGEEAAEEAAPE